MEYCIKGDNENAIQIACRFQSLRDILGQGGSDSQTGSYRDGVDSKGA